MTSLITNILHYKNKLLVGVNDSLVVKLPSDMRYFRKTTTNVDNSTIVMGRKTWFSIPSSQRPLENRFNIILTRNPELLKVPATKWSKFMTFKQFREWAIGKKDIYIIGGGEVYNMFLALPNDDFLRPVRLYITETKGAITIEPNDTLSVIKHIPEEYRLVSSTKSFFEYSYNFRFLIYKLHPGFKSEENVYLNLVKDVVDNGVERIDRTNTGTISVFGRQTTIDISNSIPILTTKRIPWKSCIEELLWFLRGDTDAKILAERGVNIWNDNASREFLDSRGLSYREGVLGPSYGWQWRFYGAKYLEEFSDTSKFDPSVIKGVDQIQKVIDTLRNDPFSRRIIITSWNPSDYDQVALPCCHHIVQFYVSVDADGQKILNCHYNMRSNDLFLGAPWNILSYSILTYILAARVGMKPGKLVYSCTDAHIYKNHVDQVKKQLSRPIRAGAKLILDPFVSTKDLRALTVYDFNIIGYFPDTSISAIMAV